MKTLCDKQVIRGKPSCLLTLDKLLSGMNLKICAISNGHPRMSTRIDLRAIYYVISLQCKPSENEVLEICKIFTEQLGFYVKHEGPCPLSIEVSGE